MTTEEQYRRILQNHLPAQAVDYVYNYLNQHKVHFHITRERRTKYGDYRWPQPKHDFHEISVNGDLNPYLFLWVFLHEAAHLETHLKYSDALPHGQEWQEQYRRLLVAHTSLFPTEAQPLLAHLTRRIPLSRKLMRQVEETLHHHDPNYSAEEHTVLDELPAGSHFRLKNKPQKLFESIQRRRTRWLCRDLDSGRQYTIAARSEVIPSPNTKH